jgi:hypothetical protein
MKFILRVLLCVLAITLPGYSWISEGQGNPLQLFSFELIGDPPVIDGSLMSRDGDPSSSEAMDEWKSASSRTLVLSDGGLAQLFLVNSPDTLYIGFTYEHGNNSDGSGVMLYFDEGSSYPPTAFDGGGDFACTAWLGLNNEQSCVIYKSGSSNIVEDRCWNGTVWVNDGDGEIDFRGARNFFSADVKVHHYEFAIPLNNDKTDDSLNSDLDVMDGQEIGFFLNVVKMGSGAGIFHWKETSSDSTHPDYEPYWAEIQLGVKREYFTFYAGYAANGAPVIDGAIDEDAWDGAYKRQIMLSNYHYSAFPTTVWCLEEPDSGYIYIGVRVYDTLHNSSDYCQIYFEETGENTTDSLRDFDLDGDAENSLMVSSAGPFQDMYWDVTSGDWLPDNEAPDSQSGTAADYPGYTDYEFRILRQAGTEDVDIPAEGLLGFLIRYHDADMGGDSAEMFWEYTTNNNGQLLDKNSTPDVHLATGWSNLQLGAPNLEITSPADNQTCYDSVPLRIAIEGDSILSAQFFTVGDTANKTSLVDSGGGVWNGTWDLTGHPVGTDTLVIRIVTSDGFTLERLVVVDIQKPPLSTEVGGKNTPAVLSLEQNHPNPFNTATRIKFSLPASEKTVVGNSNRIILGIYTVNGRRVRRLAAGSFSPGSYSVTFDGLSDTGSRLHSGTYICRIYCNGFIDQKKLLIIR